MISEQKYILLVEDSEDIRDLIQHFYKLEGYAIEVAHDGRHAMERLRASDHLPSVILLDLMMPEMDGTQFCFEQQKDPRLAAIPVLVMTADANAEKRAQDIGARGFLKKPVALDTLVKVAEKFCRK